ncbi:MAG: pentapeptide repeat-containing protein [Gammaproteobacteria bacterium]
MTDSKKWFVRRGEKIQGPFTHVVLTKLGKLGRLKPTDKLSNDQQSWIDASDFPDLFSSNETESLLKDEERSGLDRRENATDTQAEKSQKKRNKVDRRELESKEDIARRKGRSQLLDAIHESRKVDRFPVKQIIFTILAIVILGFFLKGSDPIILADCEAPANPGVVWDNCDFDNLNFSQKNLSTALIRNASLVGADLEGSTLTNADLSYSDLSGANLKSANLDGISLKGANLSLAILEAASLTDADLNHADLRGADLEGIDLEGAILDQAIWENGRVCAKNSIGTCRKE